MGKKEIIIAGAVAVLVALIQDFSDWAKILVGLIGFGLLVYGIFFVKEKERKPEITLTPRKIILANKDNGLMILVKNSPKAFVAKNVSVEAMVRGANGDPFFAEPTPLFRVTEGGDLMSSQDESFKPGRERKFLICKARPQERPFNLFVMGDTKTMLSIADNKALFSVHCLGDNFEEIVKHYKVWLEGKTLRGNRIHFEEIERPENVTWKTLKP